MQSIQLTKGLSSVLNGYESITGQINVELHKPETAPALLLNSFANQGGRMELNVVSALDVSDKLSTAFLLHGSRSPVVNDVNRDGFADMPTGSQINLNNRWHWKNPDNGWEGQMGISAIQSDKIGGQVSYAKGDNPADSLWGYESHGRRLEVFGKMVTCSKRKDVAWVCFIALATRITKVFLASGDMRRSKVRFILIPSIRILLVLPSINTAPAFPFKATYLTRW